MASSLSSLRAARAESWVGAEVFWVEVEREKVSFTELLALPGVSEELTVGSTFGICAFHGGNLERRTEIVARLAAEQSGASLYTVTQPEGMRKHLPSKFVDPAESPRLASFLDHCDVVVALHGYGRWNRWTELLVGGQNRELAAHVSLHVGRAIPAYRVISDLEKIPKELRGIHPDNPCNLPRGGGIQIELPPRVRGLSPMARHWPLPDPRPTVFPHLVDLAQGLAAAASSWDQSA